MDSVLEDLLAANRDWDGHDPDAAKTPARRLVIITCMDARIDVLGAFGLAVGEAHVLRNAGAIVTDDVERSVLLSQYTLDTSVVLVVGHTDCGLLDHDEEATRARVEAERGASPDFPLGSLDSVDQGVVESVTRLRRSAVLAHTDAIHGLVFDVGTGRLRRVEA